MKNYCNPNINGMMSDLELNWLYNTAMNMEVIVEIGSYEGKSTHALLSGNIYGKVYTIDPYSTEDFNDKCYLKMLDNLSSFKNHYVYRKPSNEAYNLFTDKTIDMLFIDGDHSYESVKLDIELWLPKVKKLICGHDYNNYYPDVKKAVNEKFVNVNIVDSIWIKEIKGE